MSHKVQYLDHYYLFYIYINDIAQISKLFEFIVYADDTALFIILSAFKTNMPQQKIGDKVNNELDKITEWLNINKLSLNILKTKCTIFHTKKRRVNPPTLKKNNTIINRVPEFNFLGLIIQENVSWKSNCDKISNSISKSIGILNRLKCILQDIELMLYNSIVVSHLNYCILAWGYEHNRVNKLQKRH